MEQWISCKERLPNVGDFVLLHSTEPNAWLYCKPHIVTEDFLKEEVKTLSNGRKFIQSSYSGEIATHWLRIPEPPEDVTEDEA